MSERASSLADRFEQTADLFVSVVEPLSAEEWLMYCPSEERTIAALARHVAIGYTVESAALRALADGNPARTWTRAQLAIVNAEGGRANERCDQAETIGMLRGQAMKAAAVVRSLTDDQLARTGVYVEELGPMMMSDLVERILIGHPLSHLASIRAALGDGLTSAAVNGAS